MYRVLSKEYIDETFPILNCEENTILIFLAKDGVCLHPVFSAIKNINYNIEKIIKKNFIDNQIQEGTLILSKHENKKILIMPIQDTWKGQYDAEFVKQGFIKISSVFKERDIDSIAIQEGVVPTDYIDQLINTLDLPKITYYANKE